MQNVARRCPTRRVRPGLPYNLRMPEFVQAGQQMVIFRDESATYIQTYRPGGRFECHLGILLYPDPLAWGSVLLTSKGVPMVILRPTFETSLERLKRRTTVVYTKEAGRIVMELGIKNGGRYAEVGSGSGSMTSVFASLVGPTGKIYSREREAEHLDQAKVNIERLGLSANVDFQLRDVIREGFGADDLDGVFVDVPNPWEIVRHAYTALAGGAPWVSLSPTVDQIVRTEQALFRAGFTRRRMVEIIEREWKLFPGRMRPQDRMVGHTAFLLVGYKVLDPDFVRKEKPH